MSETNTPVPTSPGAIAWCLLALLPVATAVGFDTAGPRPQPITLGSNHRPGLAFDQYLVNLGQVPAQAEHRAFFAFTNTGSTPVRVTALHPSCGCLDPKLPKATWEPGERAVFSLRILATREPPGPKEYTVRVEYDDGKPRETLLRLKVNLPEQKLVISPKALIFYQNTPDPITRPITLSRHHIKRLSVLDVSTSSSIVQAAIGRDRIDANGQRTAEVLVTVGAVPPGKHQAFVEIATDDPDYPEVRVPVLVMGPAAAKSAARNAEKKR
ncbi:MAG: DUF1573 domain-containing protein [Planctomycetales bacterium]|jgi:hypothetical protein|nr:DUF1573 domain-containing protein [Planctomycetales bacterium]